MAKSDQLVSRHLQELAKKINAELEIVAGQKMGFSLIVFSGDQDGDTNYVSNCSRVDAAVSLRKVLERWEEKGVLDIPAHNKH